MAGGGAQDPVPFPAPDRADDRIGVQPEGPAPTETPNEIEVLEEAVGAIPPDLLEDLAADEDPLVAEGAETREGSEMGAPSDPPEDESRIIQLEPERAADPPGPGTRQGQRRPTRLRRPD